MVAAATVGVAVVVAATVVAATTPVVAVVIVAAAVETAAAATWISKTALKTNAGSQALEDAACLVFLENEIQDFASQHAEYPREKFIEILRKTWRKMSPAAQAAALKLDLPPAIGARGLT